MRATFVPSSKGGIGKTTFVRLVGEMHRAADTGAVLVDADASVGQLLKHLGEREAQTGRILEKQSVERGVLSMDWHADVRGRDAIAEMLAHGRDVLVDLPGGSLSTFRSLADETDFFHVVRASGFDPTIVLLVTPYVETWNDVRDVQSWLPDVDVLAVVNEGFGDADDFQDWRESKTRSNLLAGRGREIVLPRLEPRIAARIARYRLRFMDAPNSEDVRVLDRGRAKTWLGKATVAISQAGDLLALSVEVSA